MGEIVESGATGLLEGIIVIICWIIVFPALIYIIGKRFGRKE